MTKLTVQEKFESAMAEEHAPAGWPDRYVAFLACHPRPAVSYEAAMKGLEAFLKAVKENRINLKAIDG